MKKVTVAEKTVNKLKMVFSMLKENKSATYKDISAALKAGFGGSISTNWVAAARRAVDANKTIEQFLGVPVTKDEHHTPRTKKAPVVNTKTKESELPELFALLLQKLAAEGFDAVEEIDMKAGTIKLRQPEHKEEVVVPERTISLKLKM